MTICEAVATRLKQLLNDKKITQYRLAILSNLSFETIKSIMKGKSKGVSLKTLVLLSEGLGMTVDEFLKSDLFNFENLTID